VFVHCAVSVCEDVQTTLGAVHAPWQKPPMHVVVAEHMLPQ
jgi:hypothetical protein